VLPHCFKGLGQYARGPDDGHEIGVSGPARNHMLMEVTGNAGPAGLAEIDAYVEAIWLESGAEQPFRLDSGVEKASALLRSKVFDVGNFSKGQHEEVSGIIGIAIHQYEAKTLPAENKRCLVVVRLREFGEGPPVFGRFLLRHVFHSPIGV